MAKARPIKWKALVLLVIFAASFTVVCHCNVEVGKCCCEKKAPCKSDCKGGQAVKFNLLEKQAPASIQPGPLPVLVMTSTFDARIAPSLPIAIDRLAAPWPYKHPPPDRLSLYKCFLI